MANRQVLKFFGKNCAQSFKKTFMRPNFHSNQIPKYTKCHIFTNWLSFPKLCVYHFAENYLPLLQQIADWLNKKSVLWEPWTNALTLVG